MTTKFAAFLTFAFLNSSATFRFLLIIFVFAGVCDCDCCAAASSNSNDLTPFVTSFVDVLEVDAFVVVGVLLLVFDFLLAVEVPK